MLENLPFGNDILEVAIALAFTYMIFSSIASGIYELFGKFLRLRSNHLKDGLKLMLEDPDGTRIVNELYKHKLIKSKLRDKLGDPTYIEATNFATAIFDFLTKDHTGEILKTKQEVIDKINANIGDGPLRKHLLKWVNEAGDKVEDIETKFQNEAKRVETWFDSHMKDVSEWFKRKSRLWMGIIAAVLTLAFNVDSIRVAKILWTDDEVRTATVKAAEGYYDSRIQTLNEQANNSGNPQGQPTVVDTAGVDSMGARRMVNVIVMPPANMDTLSSEEYFAQLNGAMDTVEALINQTTVLPIGWQDEWSSIPCCGKDSVKVAPKAPKSGKPVTAVVSQKEPSCFIWGLWKFIGLAITWGAIFLGGPYWFDIVKRLVTWRRTLSTPLNPQQGQQK